MAQHDYVIDNGSGAAVRADLNNALAAIVSTNSGSTAPATTYAYQLWVDTSLSTKYLKIRNGANNAWITLGPIDTTNFGFMPPLVQSSDPTTGASPYQMWFDTSGSPVVLKMRNAAGNGWIVFGPDAGATNLGLMPLTGGTFTGAIIGSSTDHWRVPNGTTLQRSGTAAGSLRYNTTLSVLECYVNGAWTTLGGAGGGGGSLRWNEGENSPVASLDAQWNQVYAFVSGLSQKLYTTIKVPNGYTAGSQINARIPFYSPDSSGNALITTVATLIRTGTDAITVTTNQRTSTNTAITLANANRHQMPVCDLTDSTGKINSVAVSAGDLLLVSLTRGTDTATSDLSVMPYAAEVTFQ